MQSTAKPCNRRWQERSSTFPPTSRTRKREYTLHDSSVGKHGSLRLPPVQLTVALQARACEAGRTSPRALWGKNEMTNFRQIPRPVLACQHTISVHATVERTSCSRGRLGASDRRGVGGRPVLRKKKFVLVTGQFAGPKATAAKSLLASSLMLRTGGTWGCSDTERFGPSRLRAAFASCACRSQRLFRFLADGHPRMVRRYFRPSHNLQGL